MATATVNFGTASALTVTNLHSLGDGSYWQSAVVDNGTIKGMWAEVFLTIATTTTAGDADGHVELYYAGSVDDGTDFSGGASGSEGSYTDSGDVDPDDLEIVGVMPIDASETTARTYKKRFVIPYISEDFALVIRNQSGAALASSGNAVEVQINKYDSA